MLANGIGGLLATLIVGGVVGTATVIGVVSSQTNAPSESPGNVEKPVIEYGSTQ